MRNRTSLVVLLASVVALGAQLAPAAGAASAPDRRTATQRLYADADGALRVSRAADGRVRFVGVPASSRVDNPAVSAATGVREAAASHLARYGAMLGVDTAGLTGGTVTRSVTGHDLVRYQQRVDGVPVLGGDVVVDLRADRELSSVVATGTRSTAAPAARVTAARAAATARAAVAKRLPAGKAFRVVRQGRWLFDPTVFGAPRGPGARTVWRFEVTNGVELRRQVLVDDQSGHVALDLDLITAIDRVVCDNANTPRANDVPCTSGFARTEGSGASGVVDVNDAFVLGGAVSDAYDQIAGLDLTDAIGLNVGGVKKLAQTVRWCYQGASCPYANAFWNGAQMYYGATYAGADDVVGHEMTHGVIDQNSELFYWHQSGAINESIADIMGEIVDHRNTVDAGDGAWLLGEDLPIGEIRNMSNPPAFGDPDRMTSPNYFLDTQYQDNGGVHLNSGVGNKTAFLISQGGSFNGQTITGIDGADTGLTKTGMLYYAVIQGLTSGSDYAVLADVLEQSCQNMVGTAGFTAADCTEVHEATLATELRVTPTNAPQPADAPTSCPSTTVKRLLFDSETGTPGSKFTKQSTWVRAPGTVTEPGTSTVYDVSPNATSGRGSWFGNNSASAITHSLKLATPLKLPASQKTFLWFQHWRLFEYGEVGGAPKYYDGGTVEVDNTGDAAGAQNAQGLPWSNGPKQTLNGTTRKAFGGDSLGYVSSRVDLTSYAGKTVRPQFTLRSDNSTGYYGWYLDDIRIYTCDPTVITGATPTVSGTLKVGKTLTAKPGAWSPAGLTFTYQWYRGTTKITGATAKTYTLKSGDKGKKLKVKVTGAKAGFTPVTMTSKPTGTVK